MSSFEERLWGELVEKHGALLAEMPARGAGAATADREARADAARAGMPSRVRRRTRTRVRAGESGVRRRLAPAAAICLALAAAIAAIAIAVSGGGTTSAYAVVTNADGTVTVTIAELVGLRGAGEKLASLGLPVRVVASEAGCATRPGEFKLAHLSPEQSQRIATLTGGAGAASVVIAPSAIPSGDTVVIGARELPESSGRSAVALEIVVYEGAGPPCLRAGGG